MRPPLATISRSRSPQTSFPLLSAADSTHPIGRSQCFPRLIRHPFGRPTNVGGRASRGAVEGGVRTRHQIRPAARLRGSAKVLPDSLIARLDLYRLQLCERYGPARPIAAGRTPTERKSSPPSGWTDTTVASHSRRQLHGPDPRAHHSTRGRVSAYVKTSGRDSDGGLVDVLSRRRPAVRASAGLGAGGEGRRPPISGRIERRAVLVVERYGRGGVGVAVPKSEASRL
jgi:hypothetical protein